MNDVVLNNVIEIKLKINSNIVLVIRESNVVKSYATSLRHARKSLAASTGR